MGRPPADGVLEAVGACAPVVAVAGALGADVSVGADDDVADDDPDVELGLEGAALAEEEDEPGSATELGALVPELEEHAVRARRAVTLRLEVTIDKRLAVRMAQD